MNRKLLEEFILGERSSEDPAIVQAMSEDPVFAEAILSATNTLGILHHHADRIDDVDVTSLEVTDRHREVARAGLASSPLAPILRHGLWLIPSAAAAVLIFSYATRKPVAPHTPSDATLGGEQQNLVLPQERTDFQTLDLGTTILKGEFARITFFANGDAETPLFTSGHIRESRFELSAMQRDKLLGFDRVWIVVAYVDPAGHQRTLPGQIWVR